MICTQRDVERCQKRTRDRLMSEGHSKVYAEAWIKKFDEKYDEYRDLYGWTPGGSLRANADAGYYADKYAAEFENGYLIGRTESMRLFGALFAAMENAGLSVNDIGERYLGEDLDALCAEYQVDEPLISLEVECEFERFLELRDASDATPVFRFQLAQAGLGADDARRFVDAYLEKYREVQPASELDVSSDWYAHLASLEAARKATGLDPWASS